MIACHVCVCVCVCVSIFHILTWQRWKHALLGLSCQLRISCSRVYFSTLVSLCVCVCVCVSFVCNSLPLDVSTLAARTTGILNFEMEPSGLHYVVINWMMMMPDADVCNNHSRPITSISRYPEGGG